MTRVGQVVKTAFHLFKKPFYNSFWTKSNFWSFSGSNHKASDLYKTYQAGLSNLPFDVKKIAFRKDSFFYNIFFQLSWFQAKTSRILGEKSRLVCRSSLPISLFIVQGSILGEKNWGFYKSQSFCIFNNNFRTPLENYSAVLSKLQSRV